MKQRLLGAVVLIALAVIFVPMFLSGGNREPASETVNLRIPPPPDAELQTRVMPVESPATGVATPRSEQPEPQLPVTDTVTAPSGPTPPATSTVARSPPPAASPEPAPATEQPASNAPGTAADGKYLVHLGVYAQQGNARALVVELKRGGFPAFAEAADIDGKPAQRVRVGPYADKAGAEAARLRIKRLKPSVPGSVVALTQDAKADVPVTALASGQAGGWAVQLGAFSTESDANVLRDRVRHAGFAAYTDSVKSTGKTLWRVRAGPATERAAADRMREQIKAKLKINGLIVSS